MGQNRRRVRVAFIAVTVWLYRPDAHTRGWEAVPRVLIRQEVDREMEVASKLAVAP